MTKTITINYNNEDIKLTISEDAAAICFFIRELQIELSKIREKIR